MLQILKSHPVESLVNKRIQPNPHISATIKDGMMFFYYSFVKAFLNFPKIHFFLATYIYYFVPNRDISYPSAFCKYLNFEPGYHSFIWINMCMYTSKRVFKLVVVSNLIKVFQLLVKEVDIVCICKQGSLFRVEIRPIYLQHYISLLCLAEKQTHI